MARAPCPGGDAAALCQPGWPAGMVALCRSAVLIQQEGLEPQGLCSRLCSRREKAVPCFHPCGEAASAEDSVFVPNPSYVPGALSCPLISRCGCVLQSHSSSIWPLWDKPLNSFGLGVAVGRVALLLCAQSGDSAALQVCLEQPLWLCLCWLWQPGLSERFPWEQQ